MPGSDPSLLCPTHESCPLSCPAHFGGTSPGSRAKGCCMGVMVWFRGCKSPCHTPSKSQGVLLLGEFMACWLCLQGRNSCGLFHQVLLFSVWGEKGLKWEPCVAIWFLFLLTEAAPYCNQPMPLILNVVPNIWAFEENLFETNQKGKKENWSVYF